MDVSVLTWCHWSFVKRWHFSGLNYSTWRTVWSWKKAHTLLSIVAERPFLQMLSRACCPSQQARINLSSGFSKESMKTEGWGLLCICEKKHRVRACQLCMTRTTSSGNEGYLLKGGWKNEVLCLGKAVGNSFLYSRISQRISQKTRNIISFQQ